MAALGVDAARQPEAVRATFAAGIESLLTALTHDGKQLHGADSSQLRAEMLGVLAHAVGALVLSRACPDDSPLADEVLAVCREHILASLKSSAIANAPARDRRKLGMQQEADPQNTRRGIADPTAKRRKAK